MKLRIFMAAAASLTLAACVTEEGYRKEMATWQGRMGDDLLIKWGPPSSKSTLSDGREVWLYNKTTVNEQAGYYRDESRQVTRKFKDKDGKEKTETITETYPVWQPPQTYRSSCQTRFVLAAQRVQEVGFDGNGCVAPEQN
ncbi:MAG: hypothetical protein Q8R02_13860 [Hyphomonadaceae bacterium]|nr:hypothetical protein [Hyphomonadaceae bacterium]